ncbi:autotransporter outer membrane beta-barrel domain-containing protein [Helicobacter brantae]|uniref:Autotransporter domain-containing protein n=1 Tax=Helicobacter brantae TaxID=375927 RepID=A0A3D8IZ55_9HELI|nr:autotransporter outer membrane beta-barrel domain-containing protein [Helicobacter brantae]RDU70548.1 hypothetical protein CQA58_05085 [Helicobacter brantae]
MFLRGSLALFLYLNSSYGSCISQSGAIGICVDGGGDKSSDFGITWNGLHGGGEIYQPFKKGGTPVDKLSFVFDLNTQDDDLVAKIIGSSLEINGNGKSLQMNDGNGTIAFLLQDDGDKSIALSLGKKDSSLPALKGNLIIDGESGTNTFVGTFGGEGISGDVLLGIFGSNSFNFTNHAKITGKITLQAGDTTFSSDKKSTSIMGGIFSDLGDGKLIFYDTKVHISGNLDNEGSNSGDGAIVANGGDTSLVFNTEHQNITVENKISVGNKATSHILIDITQNDSTLTLNGVSTQDGSGGTQIKFGGENATLILKEKSQQPGFNFYGGGNTITFEGKNSKILGNVSSFATKISIQPSQRTSDGLFSKQVISNLRKNLIVFNGDNGSILGNLYTQKGNNEVLFKGEGTNIIKGDITTKSGSNSVSFENTNSQSNTIIGNVYTLGLSAQTSITFGGKTTNTIQGNVSTNSGKTTIDFLGNGSISGKVHVGSDTDIYGESIILVSSHKVEIGGVEVGGQSHAFNRVKGENGNLTILTIASGDGMGNSVYAKNPHGSNSIQIPSGMLTTKSGVTSIYGKNLFNIQSLTIQSGGLHAIGSPQYSAHNIVLTRNAKIDGNITAQTHSNNTLDFKGNGNVTLGDQSSILISAKGGANIISFGPGSNNILNLTSITADGGSNILGKALLVKTNSFDRPLNNHSHSSPNAFGGKMTISQGVGSTGEGKNIILFAPNSSQNSSIISHFNKTHGTFDLKNAVFSDTGSNTLWLDLSSSSLTHTKDAIETFSKTPHSPTDRENLALSSGIAGDITSRSGDNNIFIKGGGEKDKTHSALFGNINTSGGNNNLFLKDSVIIPSSLITSEDKVLDIGAGFSGNITTTGGITHIAMHLTHYPTSQNDIFVYNLTTTGGQTHITFGGKINAEIKTRYSKESRTTLIFAQSSNGENQETDVVKIKSSSLTYHDGFKVEITGTPHSSPLLSTIKSTQTTDEYSLALGGNTTGIISLLNSSQQHSEQGVSQNSKTHSITLKEHSSFLGDFYLDSGKSSPSVTLEDNSSVFLRNLEKSQKQQSNFHIPTLIIQNHSSNQNKTNATISVATHSSDGDHFGLLKIGNSDESGKSIVKTNSGLQGKGNATFVTRVKIGADQKTATLGGEEVSKYGNTYSDRIIIANIGDNSTSQSGIFLMQVVVEDKNNISNIKYDSSQDGEKSAKGGTKTSGNIAVLTTINTGNKQAGITLKLKESIQGFDKISGTLTSAITDINGVSKQDGDYTTYFLNSLTTSGVTEERREVSVSALGGNYDLYIANFNSLNKRMGELRDNHHSQGVWARIFCGRISNDFGMGTKTSYVTLQGGYDYAFGFEGANNYLGLALSYGTSNSSIQNTLVQSLNQEILGIDYIKSNAIEVALYNSYVQDEGWYNDSIAKFSYIFSDFSMMGQSSTYSTSNMAFTLSDEFGYRFKLGSEKEWYIDPQVEVALGYFNQTSFRQVLGDSWLNALGERLIVVRSRFGSSFGYDFKRFTKHKPIQASAYAGVFYEYDCLVGGDGILTTDLGGTSTHPSTLASNGRALFNVGVHTTIKDNTRLYFDFEKSFAGKINIDYQINVGVRYSFGENDGYIPTANKKEKLPTKIEHQDFEWEE